MTMESKCPLNKKCSEICPYCKENLCDYPYMGTKKVKVAAMFEQRGSPVGNRLNGGMI